MKDSTWSDDTPVPRAREAEPGKEIGRGGLGRVLLVRDEALGRDVARKELLHDSPRARARFLREARVTAQLEHPFVVPVYTLGDDADGPSYTMRLVRGSTLTECIRAAPDAASRRRLLPHVVDACQAVAYAHSRGVVHRDLKPDNIMVGAFGETLVVDWGLARVGGDADEATAGVDAGTSAEQTRAGAVMGSPAYMSPEQARGEPADARSDVWSLGAVLFEVLAGRRPFPGLDGDEVLARLRADEFEDLGRALHGVPPDLAAIVGKALRPRPSERYRDAATMAADLVTWQSGGWVDAYRYTATERLTALARRNPVASATALGAVAVLVLGAVAFVAGLERQRDAAVAAQREAELEAAAAKVSLARNEVDLGEVAAAEAHLREAEATLQANGQPTTRVDVVRAWMRYRQPPPALTTARSPKLSASGRRMLAGGGEHWTLLEVPSGRVIGDLSGPGVFDAEFKGEEPWALVDGPDGSVLRNAAGRVATALPRDGIRRVIPHPDGWWIATLGQGLQRVDDAGQQVATLPDVHQLLGVSRDGRHVLGATVTGTRHVNPERLTVWDEDGAVTFTAPGTTTAAISPSGARVATVADRVVLTTAEGESWSLPDPTILSVQFLDEDEVLGVRGDGRFVRWSTADGRALAEGRVPGIIDGVSPNEDVVSVMQAGVRYDIHVGRPLDRRLPRLEELPTQARALPDDESFLLVGWRGSLQVVDRLTGRVLRSLPVCPQGVRDVDASPDGRWAATADRCGRIRTWDLASPGTAPVLDLAVGGIATVARFLPEGGVAGAFADGTWIEWDGVGREQRRVQLGVVPWQAQLAGDVIVASGRNDDDPEWVAVDRASGERVAGGADGVGYSLIPAEGGFVVSTQRGPLVWIDREGWAATERPGPLSVGLASRGATSVATSRSGDLLVYRGRELVDTLPLHREVPPGSIVFVGTDLLAVDESGRLHRLPLGPTEGRRAALAHALLEQGVGELSLEMLDAAVVAGEPVAALDRVRALASSGRSAEARVVLDGVAGLSPATVASWRASLSTE